MLAEKKYALFLWLIWPFGALIWAIKNTKYDAAWTLLLLFCVYFGLTFVVPEDVVGAADAARYARELKQMNASPLTFDQFLSYLYNEDSNKVDVYQPLVTWFIGQFTGNPKWLFAAFSAVYGFFYVMNLKMVVRQIEGKIHPILVILLLLLAFTIPIWNVNGVRMWTAAQVFLYGVLKFFIMRDKKSMLWVFSSVFIHFSFLFPVGIFFLFRFLPKAPKLIFMFYLLSFFISEINVEQFRSYINSLPVVFENRADAYTSEAALERFEDSGSKRLSWHVIFAKNAQNYLMQFFLIITFLFHFNTKESSFFFTDLLSFTLFFSAGANIASLLPSGGRFLLIAYVLILTTLFLKLISTSIQPNFLRLVKFTTPLMLFILVFKLREGTDFFGFLTIVGNPMIAMVIDDQVPLITFIKSLI